MKTILLLLFLTASFLTCRADYETTKLDRLLDGADLIVECKIKKVLKEKIEVSIVTFLKGSRKDSTLTVNKFTNWTCAERWDNYRKGQTEIMFLRLDDQGFLYPMGSANEGEMPIKGDTVFYKSLYMRIDKQAKHLNVGSGAIYGYSYLLTDVKAAINQYFIDKRLFSKMLKEKNYTLIKTDNPFMKRIVDEFCEQYVKVEENE